MCVGVRLVHDQLALLDTGALLELSFSPICSCCYDYRLTDLANNQHLSAQQARSSLSQVSTIQ